MESSAKQSCELVGEIEILLIDSETNEIKQHVRKRNQITEPFARGYSRGT